MKFVNNKWGRNRRHLDSNRLSSTWVHPPHTSPKDGSCSPQVPLQPLVRLFMHSFSVFQIISPPSFDFGEVRVCKQYTTVAINKLIWKLPSLWGASGRKSVPVFYSQSLCQTAFLPCSLFLDFGEEGAGHHQIFCAREGKKCSLRIHRSAGLSIDDWGIPCSHAWLSPASPAVVSESKQHRFYE